MNLINEQINEVEYSSCLVDINKEVNFITLLLNKNLFSYNIHKNVFCNKCKNLNVCLDYINRTRNKILNSMFEHDYNKVERIRIKKFNDVDEVMKLNIDYVKFRMNKSKSKNIQLKRRIEQMNLNNEKIPSIKL